MRTPRVTAGVPYVLRLKAGLRGPSTPVRGSDVAGVVEAVGARVDDLRPGDEVFGSLWDAARITLPHGTFAELTVAPAAQVVRKPAGVSFEAAGAAGMAGLTALAAVREVGQVVERLAAIVRRRERSTRVLRRPAEGIVERGAQRGWIFRWHYDRSHAVDRKLADTAYGSGHAR